jgi:hypothetical protein
MVSVQCLIVWLHTLSSVLCLSTRLYRLQPSIQTPSAACIPPSQEYSPNVSQIASRKICSSSSSLKKSSTKSSTSMSSSSILQSLNPWVPSLLLPSIYLLSPFFQSPFRFLHYLPQQPLIPQYLLQLPHIRFSNSLILVRIISLSPGLSTNYPHAESILNLS